MPPHRVVPLALLGVLVVLTAGFAVLAWTMAPDSADLAVHNGTLETFSADQFSLSLTTSSTSSVQSGSQSEVRVVDYHAPDRMLVYRATPALHLLGSLGHKDIAAAIDAYAGITAGPTSWVRHGSHFDRTESLQAFSVRQGERTTASGQVHETAFVRNGYLVVVDLLLHAQVAATAGHSVSVAETETLHVVSINGAKAPAVTS